MRGWRVLRVPFAGRRPPREEGGFRAAGVLVYLSRRRPRSGFRGIAWIAAGALAVALLMEPVGVGGFVGSVATVAEFVAGVAGLAAMVAGLTAVFAFLVSAPLLVAALLCLCLVNGAERRLARPGA